MRDRFEKWRKDGDISVEEMILLEQFIAGVPEGLAIWLKEKEPKSLAQAAELADTYALAREDNGKGALKEATHPWGHPLVATNRSPGERNPVSQQSKKGVTRQISEERNAASSATDGDI